MIIQNSEPQAKHQHGSFAQAIQRFTFRQPSGYSGHFGGVGNEKFGRKTGNFFFRGEEGARQCTSSPESSSLRPLQCVILAGTGIGYGVNHKERAAEINRNARDRLYKGRKGADK